MENPTGKQLLIQFGIQLVTSAIVSYIMYRILEKNASNKTKTTVSNQTPPPSAIPQTVTEETV